MIKTFGCVLALTAASGTAMAHAMLMSSVPADGAALKTAPVRLRLKFNEVPRLTGTGVELTGPDGKARSLMPLAKDPADLRGIVAPLPFGLAPGRYQVRWRALSPDAHHSAGQFAFSVARP
jgi:methionine-rich copper-binding protein CopC